MLARRLLNKISTKGTSHKSLQMAVSTKVRDDIPKRSKSSTAIAASKNFRIPIRRQQTGLNVRDAMEDYFKNSDESELFEEESFSKEEIPADEELYDEDLTTFGGVENFFH